MIIYELKHLFFRYDNEFIYSPKCLGFYTSYESAYQALQYYCTKPGFSDNQDALSIQERVVSDKITDKTVYEVIVYLHSRDYEFEIEIELGLYGDEAHAQKVLLTYCENNTSLIHVENLVVEKIINRRILEIREWAEGFLVAE